MLKLESMKGMKLSLKQREGKLCFFIYRAILMGIVLICHVILIAAFPPTISLGIQR